MQQPPDNIPHDEARKQEPPPPPTALPVSIDHIPPQLRALKQWVCWRYEYQPQRSAEKPWTKVPINPYSGKHASSTNPMTWGTFDDALTCFRRPHQNLDGIGFVVIAKNGLVGIDLDHCRDPDAGDIIPWARAIVDRLQTYTEVSPSGTGLRLWLRATLPLKGRKNGDVEMYNTGRFLTVTGCHLQGTPVTIEPRQAELDAAHTKVFAAKASHEASEASSGARDSKAHLNDDQLLEKALAARNGPKFARLWGGDTSDYPSHSEADLALCDLLTFWTQDEAQVDRLFRRSGLMRGKWDEVHGDATYGQSTIRLALSRAGQRWSSRNDRQSKTKTERMARALPAIDASNLNLPAIAEEAWDALLTANMPPRFFLHGRRPTRLERDKDQACILVNLTRERLRHELGRVATWYVPEKQDDGTWGQKIVLPPMWLVDDMLARPELPFPWLTRITETPVFAPDGTLQTTPGYHLASQTMYAPPPRLQVPEVPARPTAGDVMLATKLIDEMLHDFPFVDAADKAHAKALWLLPFVRDLIPDPTPNHLIESPGPGSGKGLLADVLLRPAVGQHVGIVTEAKDEDEIRKRLTTRLREARAVLLLDNIRRPLDSAQLAAALTALYWEDRLLGTNETIRVPIRCAWVTTGNNPVLSTEIARRSIRIRLDPKLDRPWLRTGFQHPNLRTWVNQNRGRLIWAALILTQYWVAQDRPPPTLKPLGSYEEWSMVVGGILQAAGIEGFLTNLEEFYEIADHEGTLWRAFVVQWWVKFRSQSVGVSELLPLAFDMDGFALNQATERGQRTAFGSQLRKQRDRVIGDYRIVSGGESHRAARWRLLPVQPIGKDPL
jgi:hypothetical protein